MDTQPSDEAIGRIRSIAEAVPDVDQVQKCIVRRMGNQLLVDMHVHVDPDMSVEKSHAIAHCVKDSIRDGVPAVLDVLIHIEPSRRKDA